MKKTHIIKDVKDVLILTMKTEMDFSLRCLVADLFFPRTFTEVVRLTDMDEIPIELNQGNAFDERDIRSRQRIRFPGGTYKTTLRVAFNLGVHYNIRDAKLGDVMVRILNVDRCLPRFGIRISIVLDKRMPGRRHTIWKELQDRTGRRKIRAHYLQQDGILLVEYDSSLYRVIYASDFEDTQSVRDTSFFPAAMTAACCLRRILGKDVSRLILHYIRYMRREWSVSHTPSVLLKPREPKIQT